MTSEFGIGIWSIPFVSAFVGYGTNYLAVKMIFRPRKPVRFCGLVLHGLIPKRHKEIAKKLGELIERDLISHEDVRKALKSPAISSEAQTFVSAQVDQFAAQILGSNPMAAMLLSGSLLEQIKGKLADQVSSQFPEFIDSILQTVEGELDFSQIVQAKIEAFDLGKLESIIYEISARELRAIEVLGGVLGFAIGLLQILFIYLGLNIL